MKFQYLLLDVFTDRRLTGNPLAVVLNADTLLDNQMQAIAREFNLSETVFIRRPEAVRHTAAVRIFTPYSELPFAGHPTIGAAVVLGIQGRASAVRLEEAVGLVTCVMDNVGKDRGSARFALPRLPSEIGAAPDVKKIAYSLGLEPDDIGCGPYKPGRWSAGLPFYLVPVRNAAVLGRVAPERRGWAEVYPLEHSNVYVFTQTPEERGVDFAARMFSPQIGEDPATGSAAAALIGPLAQHADPGQTELVVRQGDEMGRPSRINVQFRKDGDELTHGGIGGSAIVVGEGTLDIGA